jgi:hypothetical protein
LPAVADVLNPEGWLRFRDTILKNGDGENPRVPELFDKETSGEKRAAALRRWLDFWSKGEYDDRTIVVIN